MFSCRSPEGTCAMSEPRRWSDYPLVQLTLVRYREFIREPEAVFWVFVFPLLLAAGLGIAFRSQPAERAAIALPERAPGAGVLAETLRRDNRLTVQLLDDSAA